MQHREAAEAPPQVPDEHSTEPGYAQVMQGMAGRALDQFSELAALSWSVSASYGEQIKLTGELAKTEWQLSGRSAVVAAALAVCFGSGLMLLWAGILLLLGIVLFQFGASLLQAAAIILLLQVGLLLWCWRSLNYVLSQIGFGQTWQQLTRLFNHNTSASGAAGGQDVDK